MDNSTEKRIRAIVMASVAVAEQVGLLQLLGVVDMGERPDPNASEIGPGGLALGATMLVNVALACALYVYSKRMLSDPFERVYYASLAMVIAPWSIVLLSPLAAFVPGQFILLVGIIVPYATVVARLSRLR